LLPLAQLVVGRLQQLGEQLLLGGEVPVEDALADAEGLDDVGDRSRVVATLGEEACRAVDELVAPLAAPGRQLSAHRRRVAVLLPAWSRVGGQRAAVSQTSPGVLVGVTVSERARHDSGRS